MYAAFDRLCCRGKRDWPRPSLPPKGIVQSIAEIEGWSDSIVEEILSNPIHVRILFKILPPIYTHMLTLQNCDTPLYSFIKGLKYPSFTDPPELIIKTLRRIPWLFVYFPPSLQAMLQMAMFAVYHSPSLYSHVKGAARLSRVLAMYAVVKFPRNIVTVDKGLRNSLLFAYPVILRHPELLGHMGPRVRMDADLCELAVSMDPRSAIHVHVKNPLWDTLVTAAISVDRNVFSYMPLSWRSNPGMANQACDIDPANRIYVPKRILRACELMTLTPTRIQLRKGFMIIRKDPTRFDQIACDGTEVFLSMYSLCRNPSRYPLVSLPTKECRAITLMVLSRDPSMVRRIPPQYRMFPSALALQTSHGKSWTPAEFEPHASCPYLVELVATRHPGFKFKNSVTVNKDVDMLNSIMNSERVRRT